MADELKRCPFGCKDHRVVLEKENGWYYVKCQLCGTQGPFHRTEKSAVKFWNTRQEECDRMREEILEILRHAEYIATGCESASYISSIVRTIKYHAQKALNNDGGEG